MNFFFCQVFSDRISSFSPRFWFFISPNVPVVNDGLPARIGALRSKDQGWQTVLE
jgi:hypothetical protein